MKQLTVNYAILILTIAIFTGCATSTLYYSSDKINVSKIGFVNLTADTVLEKIYSGTNDIFITTVPISFKEFGIDSTYYLNNRFNYLHPDTMAIKILCKNQHLDGLILSQLKFLITRKEILYLDPTAQNTDSEVSIKLFDSSGKHIITTAYTTVFRYSLGERTASKTIKKATRGAIKRLVAEIKMNSGN